MNRRAKLSPFVLAIWGLGLLLAAYLAVWPLVENVIAASTWQKQACFLDGEGPGKGHFIYNLKGTTYIRGRRSFWDSHHGEQQFTTDVWDGKPNGTCWINPSNPGDSVLALTGFSDPLASKALIFAGIVLALCPLITWFTRRKARQAAQRAVPRAGAAPADIAAPDVAAPTSSAAGDAP